MKFFIAFIIMLLITGCSYGDNKANMNKTKMVTKMKAEEENQYHLYSFWADGTESEFDAFDYSSVDREVVRLLSFHQKENSPEYIKALEINEFPTFIVLDNDGVVLRTTDVTEINEFLMEYQLAEFNN